MNALVEIAHGRKEHSYVSVQLLEICCSKPVEEC